ncbi:HAD family acid phosphatase [Stenotrophomonas sp.]|uniref:5'-nucleotidase, lipoprotein e(P4) family n=1 Tax=Stenotrophomonas sp. TaxID=69392 RepID=UPI0028AEB511|nr:HAD family acid phosphatase [Stenotrophomonas sp.]
MSRFPALTLLAGTVLSLAACSASAPLSRVAPVPADAVVAPANAPNDNLNAVLWVQRSQEYRASALQTWKLAGAQLDAALADGNWTALLPEEGGNHQSAKLKPAVVVDVDETVLDNSPYQARLVRDGSSYNDATWEAWVNERKAQAVPGAVQFAQAAAAKGVTMIYISNRTAAMKDATVDNLRKVGLPVADDSVYLGLGTPVPGCTEHGSEKGCRRQLVAQQYRVLMQVGDQFTDFLQVEDNSLAARDLLLDKYQGWIGSRWWILPNPTYGGWEGAAINNAWSLPADLRNGAKREALEVAR